MIETKEKLVTTDQGVELPKEDCTWSDIQGVWISDDDVVRCHDGQPMTEEYRDDYYQICEDTGDWHHQDDTWYDEVAETCYSDNEDLTVSYCGTTAHEDSFSESHEYHYVDRGLARGQYVYCDQATYCEDIDEYVHEDDAHWCENDDCSYYDEDMCGGGNDVVNSYHSSSRFIENHNYGFNKSPFSIGFEVEKTEFDTKYGTADSQGDEVGEYSFFAGFETDSSCGVEAVSHVFPLSPVRSKWRSEVFRMIDEAADIINSDADISCGGHITVSMSKDGYEGDAYDVVNDLKPKLALMYALYRFRLKRSYCRNNKSIKKEDNAKYSPVNVKTGGRIEFRLPSRVASVEQLKLRYDFVYSMFHYTFNEPAAFDDFLFYTRHIVSRMYKGDEDKVNKIHAYAREFRKYLASEEVSPTIEQFINPTNDN